MPVGACGGLYVFLELRLFWFDRGDPPAVVSLMAVWAKVLGMQRSRNDSGPQITLRRAIDFRSYWLSLSRGPRATSLPLENVT